MSCRENMTLEAFHGSLLKDCGPDIPAATKGHLDNPTEKHSVHPLDLQVSIVAQAEVMSRENRQSLILFLPQHVSHPRNGCWQSRYS